MKILVGIDKSPESRMALAYTCHLLEHFDASVDVLYVKPDEVEMAAETFYAPFFSKDSLKEWIDSDEQAIIDQAAENCEYCLAGRVPCNPMVLTGDPAEEILETAREGDYDMLVLGSQGHSALRGVPSWSCTCKGFASDWPACTHREGFSSDQAGSGSVPWFSMRSAGAQVCGAATD